jgi:hypothetical protein
VDHVRQVRNVDAPGGHVGGDEEVHPLLAEQAHHPLAVVLREVAVEVLRAVARVLQPPRDQLGLRLGVAEHQRRVGLLDLQHLEQVGHRAPGGGEVRVVLDARRRDVVAAERDGHSARAGAAAMRDMASGIVAEKISAWRPLGSMLEDGVELLGEAHGEHLVALVEHDGAEVGDIEGLAAEVVERAARGADDHLGARLEGVDLLLHPGAAVDRGDPELGVLAEALELARHLKRQLARGAEHHHLDVARGLDHPVDERQREGRRLAAAGAALDDDVLALGDGLEGRLLHRRGRRVAHLGHRPAHRLAQPERLEGLHFTHGEFPGLPSARPASSPTASRHNLT